MSVQQSQERLLVGGQRTGERDGETQYRKSEFYACVAHVYVYVCVCVVNVCLMRKYIYIYSERLRIPESFDDDDGKTSRTLF